MYSKLYPTKVSDAFQERKDEIEDPEAPGARLNFHRKVAREMFLEETEEVQKEVHDASEKERNREGDEDGDWEMVCGDDIIEAARIALVLENLHTLRI